MVQSVGFQQAPLVRLGRRKFGFRVRLAQVELGGILQLCGAGRVGDVAVHGNRPDEPAIGGEESDDHAVFVRIGLDLNVGIPSGGEQAFDAGPHHRHLKRLAAFHGQNLKQLIGFQGLHRGIELNVFYRLAFVLLILSVADPQPAHGDKQEHAKNEGKPPAHDPHDSVSAP